MSINKNTLTPHQLREYEFLERCCARHKHSWKTWRMMFWMLLAVSSALITLALLGLHVLASKVP